MMSADSPLQLLWLRRDLRLHDHAAWAEALAGGGAVQAVFVFDTEILAAFPHPTDRRLTFLAHTLCQMDAALRAKGGGLMVLHGRAAEMIPALAQGLNATRVVCAADFEPATRARDKAVADACPLVRVKDHLIRAPHEVLKDDGTPYKVFTPYSKAWRARLTPEDIAEKPVVLDGRLADVATIAARVDALGLKRIPTEHGPDAMLAAIGYQPVDVAGWLPEQAQERLQRFIEHGLRGYSDRRNTMADEGGTSRLSPYLRFGLVSVHECARAALQWDYSYTWVNELIWREFYAMILFHYPHTVADAFVEKYRGDVLRWRNDPAHIAAWEEGRTGYPVVDAAMRELRSTGWMHNRARMVVASFLTKHLQCDWRIGEAFFAQHLMDYELASNVGGWQWAASTGTDAQPYFRVFNPTTQGEKFDANGDYIRRYVPELAMMPAPLVHTPHKKGTLKAYPAPVVEHAQARLAAMAMFKDG